MVKGNFNATIFDHISADAFLSANLILYSYVLVFSKRSRLSNSYTMGCPPVRGDNPRALASGLSYVQVDKHGITILYHLDQCRPCTTRGI